VIPTYSLARLRVPAFSAGKHVNKYALIRIGLALAVLGAMTTFAFAQAPPRSLEMLTTWISELGTLNTANELTPDEPDRSTLAPLKNAFVRDSAASFHVLFCEPEGRTHR